MDAGAEDTREGRALRALARWVSQPASALPTVPAPLNPASSSGAAAAAPARSQPRRLPGAASRPAGGTEGSVTLIASHATLTCSGDAQCNSQRRWCVTEQACRWEGRPTLERRWAWMGSAISASKGGMTCGGERGRKGRAMVGCKCNCKQAGRGPQAGPVPVQASALGASQSAPTQH